MRFPIAPPALCLLAACSPGGGQGDDGPLPGVEEASAFAGIGKTERLDFVGTEPFWGGHVARGRLLYTTSEDIAGTPLVVERFTGLGGLAFSGTLEGRALDMAVSEAPCSDQMSDRTYPYTVTLLIDGEQRHGCGWTEARPYVPATTP